MISPSLRLSRRPSSGAPCSDASRTWGRRNRKRRKRRKRLHLVARHRGEDESEVLGGVPGEGPKAVAALVVSGHLHAAPRQGAGSQEEGKEGKEGERWGIRG